MKVEDLDQLIILSFRLSNLLEVGTPILRALDSCVDAMGTEGIHGAVQEVREEAALGNSLTAAFRGRPDVFPQFFVDMVKTGEDRGNLDETLRKLSHALEREKALHVRSVEREGEGAANVILDLLQGLWTDGVRRLRVERRGEDTVCAAEPEAAASEQRLNEICRRPVAFLRGLLTLLGEENRFPFEKGPGLMTGRVLGSPPFFCATSILPAAAGITAVLRFHDFPEDPMEEDLLVVSDSDRQVLSQWLEARQGLIAIAGRGRQGPRQVLGLALAAAGPRAGRSCAWLERSHWPPVKDVTSLRLDPSLPGQDEEILVAMGYEVIGVTATVQDAIDPLLQLSQQGCLVVVALPVPLADVREERWQGLPLLGQCLVSPAEAEGTFALKLSPSSLRG